MVVLSVYSACPSEVSGKLQSLFLFAVLLFMSILLYHNLAACTTSAFSRVQYLTHCIYFWTVLLTNTPFKFSNCADIVGGFSNRLW